MSAPPPIQVSNTGTGPSSPLRNQVPEDAVDELGPSRSQSVLSMKRLSYQRPPLRQSMHGHNSSVTSRTASLHEASVEDIGLALKYLSRRATLLGLFDEPEGLSPSETCIAVKAPEDGYIFQPSDVSPLLALAIARLGSRSVMAICPDVVPSIIDFITPGQKSIFVEATGAQIPVANSLHDVHSDLASISNACIVVQEQVMLVWSNDSRTLVNVAHDIETQLLALSSRPQSRATKFNASRQSSAIWHLGGNQDSELFVRGGLDEKNNIYKRAIALEEKVDDQDDSDADIEGNAPVRPTLRMHAVKVSIAFTLIIVTQSLAVAKLLRQYMWDGSMLRFALVATVIPLALISLFFFISLVTGFFQIGLPVGACMKNSKYHSAIKPNPKRHKNYELPHITIQMPVYKEGLKGVIVPTMVTVMAAIQYYEEQGGTASVFINDDGMQCIQPELAEARRQYYRENGIGFTARLPNRQLPQKKSWFSFLKKKSADTIEGEKQIPTPQKTANEIGFERKGKFKKASNMNYALSFSNRVEDEMSRLMRVECEKRGCTEQDLTAEDDDELYNQALQNMLEEDEGRTWAEGNIRLGELILIIDCDTRVPVDSLFYGALEMHESPEVAILQHGSGVMQVVHNTFENGITYFTNVVYTAIKYGVGTGDVSPFVGHNAFLRWKAIQSVAFVDESDGQTKWWSDSHVSEDFDISLRVQMAGMTVRLATYHGGDFKEGVSLTLYDELTRWEKYAYGCNELVFNPFYQWIYKGPVTRLFLRFLWSNIPVTSKVTILAYIFTYMGIASGMFLTIVNYFVIGLFPDDVDHFYLRSWGVWVSLVIVFSGFGSVAFSMLRHKLKEVAFWLALLEAIKWLPFMFLYFGGLSLNCAKAILCHFLGINIEWASTAKEMGPTGFYIGLGKMIQAFKYTWSVCLLLTGMMIYFAVGAPWGWNITPGPHSTAVIAIAPLSIQVFCAFFLPLFLGIS